MENIRKNVAIESLKTASGNSLQEHDISSHAFQVTLSVRAGYYSTCSL